MMAGKSTERVRKASVGELPQLQVGVKRQKTSLQLPPQETLRVEEYFQNIMPHLPISRRFGKWQSKIREYVRDRGSKGAVAAHRGFVGKVLNGEQGSGVGCSSDRECLEACKNYVAALRRMFPHLILDPFVISEAKLDANDNDEDTLKKIGLLKLLCRRFIVWTPREKKKGVWDFTMARLWDRIYQNMSTQPYGELRNPDDPKRMSCLLTSTRWRNGNVTKSCVGNSSSLEELKKEVLQGSGDKKLYLTDGSLPNYEVKHISENTPGLSCEVNDAANGMLPHMLRSNRQDSLFNFMKVESTGVSTFTFFMPLGCGANLTAFHCETKRLRSLNCGSGDLIFQPLATTENLRKLERLHISLFGRYERQAQLLPIEMYLEEGIQMVVYLRDKDYAECVELPLFSCHTFVTHATMLSTSPPYKVACNDFSLEKEPLVVYFLEQIAALDKGSCLGGVLQEAADSWFESIYLVNCDYDDSSQSPWAPEISGLEGAEYSGVEKDNRRQDMKTIIIRLSERLMDLVDGRLRTPMDSEVPKKSQVLEALASCLPALYDIYNTLVETSPISGLPGGPEGVYLKRLINRVEAAGCYGTPLMKILRMGMMERIKAVEKKIKASYPPTLKSTQIQIWDKWCEALYCHTEVLRQGRHDLVPHAIQYQNMAELRMEDSCAAWSKAT